MRDNTSALAVSSDDDCYLVFPFGHRFCWIILGYLGQRVPETLLSQTTENPGEPVSGLVVCTEIYPIDESDV